MCGLSSLVVCHLKTSVRLVDIGFMSEHARLTVSGLAQLEIFLGSGWLASRDRFTCEVEKP